MPQDLQIVRSSAIESPQCYGDPGIYKNNCMPIVTTANLPAAGTPHMNGRFMIEDTGVSGNFNFVIYMNDLRYKIQWPLLSF